jgi:hypothetical protein
VTRAASPASYFLISPATEAGVIALTSARRPKFLRRSSSRLSLATSAPMPLESQTITAAPTASASSAQRAFPNTRS